MRSAFHAAFTTTSLVRYNHCSENFSCANSASLFQRRNVFQWLLSVHV
jgi:hypothetical protein